MTTKLTAIIVDDEPLALKLLRSKLASLDGVEVIAEGKNGRQAIELIMEHSPDLVFLDIEMPGLNGFDVITHLQSDLVPMVIFTTAYEQYALDAFDIHAVDYVLKPIDLERIERAVERAIMRHQANESNLAKQQVIQAISHIDASTTNTSNKASVYEVPSATGNFVEQKIVVKERDEITLLKQSEIKWIDAAGDYVCLHVDGETHIKRSTMKELLDELDPTIFKRIHRSTIVNLNFIEKVIPHTKGEFFLVLGEYERIKVSRNYKDAIKAFISKSN